MERRSGEHRAATLSPNRLTRQVPFMVSGVTSISSWRRSFDVRLQYFLISLRQACYAPRGPSDRRRKSASTILCTMPSKSTVGDHPNFARAFLASP